MSDAKSELEALCVRLLGPDPELATDLQITRYFNACISSGCGAVFAKHGAAGVFGMLALWVAAYEKKINEASGE